MTPPPFTGQGDRPESVTTAHDKPETAYARDYRASPELTRAVNVALHLHMPLLLTGEPGTGKTDLAYRLAWELGLPLHRFDTKSTSVASDLFYQFDNVRHFAQSQLAAAANRALPATAEFIRYQALGLAVLQSRATETGIQDLLSARQRAHVHLTTASRSIVLIDEIDKAPRDFPNDLLSQIDHGRVRFDIPDLGEYEVSASPDLQPIIILTSNAEKQLPDAFLRRCVFHHIQVPRESEAQQAWAWEILSKRAARDVADDMTRRLRGETTGNAEQAHQLIQVGSQNLTMQAAVAFFFSLRNEQFEKQPSTSELIVSGWGTQIDGSGAVKAQSRR